MILLSIMNLFIAPIAKDGTRKIGLKVAGANSRFIESFKSFDFANSAISTEFEYFFHFCGELRQALVGTEYKSIELTDGYDVQDVNYYIDYTQNPVKLVCEDKNGLPFDDTQSRQIKLTYKKVTGEIKVYKVEKVIERTEFELKCVIEGGGFRNFKVDRILKEENI